MSVGNIRNIPHFLTARSPQGLQRLMLLTNTRAGRQFNYYAINFDGTNWIAWYLKEAEIPQSDILRPPVRRGR